MPNVKTQKAGYWVPHELKDRDIKRRKTICKMLFQRQKKKGFLHRIITGDEKWICYGNPKSKKPWVKSGEPDPAQRKRDVYCGEIVLGI